MKRALVVLAAVSLAACGSPDHTNPFDPATPPALQARARLTGRVTLEAAATAPVLSGVHISIPGTSLSADTDGAGAYAIAGVPPGNWAVQAVRAGWDDGLVTGVGVRLDDGDHDVAVPTLALKLSRGQVAGTLTLQHEATAGGIAVALTGVPGAAVTDGGGAYLLSGVPVGSYTLVATKVGFKETSVASVLVQAGQATIVPSTQLDYDPGAFQGAVQVLGAATSGGVLLRASGTTLNGSAYETTTQNRPDGTYLFSGLPAGSYNLSFELQDYAPVTLAAAVAPGKVTDLAPVSLVRDTGSVAGVATLHLSTDHTGIQVTLTPLPTVGNPTPSPAAAAVTGSGGNWRVDGLPVGTYDVAYSKQPGYLATTGQVTVVAKALVLAASVELADIPGLVQGKVLLEGRGAGALDGTSVHEQSGAPVLTAADGSFALGVSAGARTIVFDRAGWDTQRVQVAVSPGVTLTLADVSLPISRGSLQGTFRLTGPAGLSSAGVVVTAALSGGGFTTSTVTDSTGAFQLSGLPVGTYTVTGRRDPDWQPQAVAGVVINAAATTTVPGTPISLLPVTTASVSGTVLLAGAASHAGTTVTLSGTDFRGAGVGPLATTSAGSGGWTFTGLAAGSYQVQYALARYDAPAPIGVALASGQALSVGTTTLQVSTGTVAGTVALSAGAATGFPVGSDRSGVVVTLTAPDGTTRSTVTDAAGAWSFQGVPVSLVGGTHGVVARQGSYLPATGTVTVVASATASVPVLTLVVDLGGLSGSVTLWDNVAGTGNNATSAGAAVSLVGTAFNGAAWSAATTSAANGTFTAASLPPGSYDVLATSAGRVCQAFSRATVAPGATAAAGAVRCTDAVAPGALALGAPQAPAGGLSGWTSASSVVVPVTTQAVDATPTTGNLRGYQVVVGSAADWSVATLVPGTPATLIFSGLTANAVNLLWVRPLDWAGNAGPVASAQVIHDGIVPPVPTITTPRPVVDATTTSVTLSGSDGDAGFGGYETCTLAQAAATPCAAPAPGGCVWAATSPSFALSLPQNQRTCLWARAWDKAGNRSAAAPMGAAGVTSDLIPPTPPTFVPSFDPLLVTVRSPFVDFFVDVASTDAPAGGAAWDQVAWIEVDAGAGFQPLCPDATCHPNGAYAPCAAGCSCGDARRLCDGTRFAGVRVPLLEGNANDVAFRAVDLAGNAGSGVSQQVRADSTGDLLAGSTDADAGPAVRANLVTFDSTVPGFAPHGVIVELGPDRRYQSSDRRCDLAFSVPGAGVPGASTAGAGIAPANQALVVVADTGLRRAVAVRPGPDGLFCTVDDPAPTGFYTAPAGFQMEAISGAGETAAWVESDYVNGLAHLRVQEPGADGLLATGDDVSTQLDSANYLLWPTVTPRAVLVQRSVCGKGCTSDLAWRVFNADPTFGFASGVTSVDLPPATVQVPALSPDGRQLAWFGGGKLWVRGSGANGAFDAVDDVTTSIVIPPAWGIGLPASNPKPVVAVEGDHIVMLATTSVVNWILHWWAGPDGVFGTADDTLQRIHPTATAWGNVSLSDSYAVVQEGNDIRAVDLSYLRWEAAPANGLWTPVSGSGTSTRALAVDGRGNILYKTRTREVHARSASGGDTTLGVLFGDFEAQGTTLLTVEANRIMARAPDAGGLWFTAGAPAAVPAYTAGGSAAFRSLTMGGGKAIAAEYTGTGYRYRILEPGAGSLFTMGTTGTVVDMLGADENYPYAHVITATQAFASCHGVTGDLCVRNAGPDGVFGTGDDTTAILNHPPGSPRYSPSVPVPVHDARAVKVSGRFMLVAEFNPPALYLFDAGNDGKFGTTDDRGRRLALGSFTDVDISMAGPHGAWLAEGTPGGLQAWVVRNFDGAPTQVTSHASVKANPVMEAGGRVFWSDSVFAPEAIFLRAP